uniref:DNA-directed RNA polymerase subunit Rpo6 n=2 Tax=environmental samples TaxID=651140 RepID=A0A075HZH9_9ARCH|nr:DNA-directed RNA polymerase subunit K (RPB6, POLR2F) [uncultured marine thaumarchaeote KM3_97_A02]
MTSTLETVPEYISRYLARRIYNRFQMIFWLSKSEENIDETDEAINSEDESGSVNENTAKILSRSLEIAIEQFRKVREGGREDITEKEFAEIDKECEIIRNREIITKDLSHEKVEITSKDDQIVIGPPILTRFEKARIMGARALQLSVGAPVFIEIPKNATTSLEIAMEELKQRVIPIVIKRTLPNGDYQNIPLAKFE